MAIDKELINLGLNIDQTNKIKKLNKKFTQGIDQLDKSNKEGHKTSQAWEEWRSRLRLKIQLEI